MNSILQILQASLNQVAFLSISSYVQYKFTTSSVLFENWDIHFSYLLCLFIYVCPVLLHAAYCRISGNVINFNNEALCICIYFFLTVQIGIMCFKQPFNIELLAIAAFTLHEITYMFESWFGHDIALTICFFSILKYTFGLTQHFKYKSVVFDRIGLYGWIYASYCELFVVTCISYYHVVTYLKFDYFVLGFMFASTHLIPLEKQTVVNDIYNPTFIVNFDFMITDSEIVQEDKEKVGQIEHNEFETELERVIIEEYTEDVIWPKIDPLNLPDIQDDVKIVNSVVNEVKISKRRMKKNNMVVV
jgi:hypothetical protein